MCKYKSVDKKFANDKSTTLFQLGITLGQIPCLGVSVCEGQTH